jgi:chemotaxis protein CheY-P-specific phosphatase CheC
MERAARDGLGASFSETLTMAGFPGVRVSFRDPYPVGLSDVVCSVGLTGGLSGFFMLAFGAPDLAKVAKRMAIHSGIESSGGGVSHKEAAAELANQLAGRAVNELARRGLDCMITPPTVVTGSSIQASFPHFDDEDSWEVSAEGSNFRISLLTRKKRKAPEIS